MAANTDQPANTVVNIPLISSTTPSPTMLSHAPIFEQNTPSQIAQAIKEAKEAFKSGQTKDVKFRREQLKKLLSLVDENKDLICQALKADLNKPQFETLLCEHALLVNEIKECLHQLDNFSKPEYRAKSILTLFDKVYVQNEPLGTVLVMGAWNYPFLLHLQPVAGAIAAGNSVIMKMSEHSPNTGKLMAELFPKYLNTSCYKVINCDLPTTQYLLAEHKFDHIFYTGGENGGKAVYSAASKNLTPVVLELGGKSPVYIDDDVCDRESVWYRLFWGKFLNAGQTCIAPDYVLCSEKAQQMARKYFHKALNQFYNGDAMNSEHYPRIVNSQHFERLKKMIKESRMVIGGKLNQDNLTIEPAIVLDVSLDDSIMQHEIFGPILPFVTCASAQKAIDIINARPKPLALYVFSDSKKLQDKFLKNTSSGGVVINDTILHISVISLPFGGVGTSGFGKYHGRYSLETFSNQRSVLSRGYNPILDWIGSNRYPPYNNTKLTILTQLGMNRKFWFPGPILTNCLAFATGAASIYAYQTFSTMFPISKLFIMYSDGAQKSAGFMESFRDKLNAIRKLIDEDKYRKRVLLLCQQTEPRSFEEYSSSGSFRKLEKFESSTYSEVLKAIDSTDNNRPVVMKIMRAITKTVMKRLPSVATKGCQSYNDILNELVVTQALSHLHEGVNMSLQAHQPEALFKTQAFCLIHEIKVVSGNLERTLSRSQREAASGAKAITIDPESDKKGSDKANENHADDKNQIEIKDDELRTLSEDDRMLIESLPHEYVVTVMKHDGQPLWWMMSHKKLTSEQLSSVLVQVIVGIAIAETVYSYEHRDLHVSNILIKKTPKAQIPFVLNGNRYNIVSHGIKATIIDATFSRLSHNGKVYFRDLTSTLSAYGSKKTPTRMSLQNRSYRQMVHITKDNWEDFKPKTNLVWLTYLCETLMKNEVMKNNANLLAEIKRIRDWTLKVSNTLELLCYFPFDKETKHKQTQLTASIPAVISSSTPTPNTKKHIDVKPNTSNKNLPQQVTKDTHKFKTTISKNPNTNSHHNKQLDQPSSRFSNFNSSVISALSGTSVISKASGTRDKKARKKDNSKSDKI